ncbi:MULTISPECIES: MFS transporter [unclassified Paraburkholderia]|uniref:MFS transporter n=1 Tax=unclassified Paraburkholderia TaxID=2615204 RepID=UPI002AB6C400|nr:MULTISPECIES: MFS transporter [unclassified Paraburkholderia]
MTDSQIFRRGPAWTIVVLLQLYMLVNFLDKIALSMTAVPLMSELNLSAAQFGMISGSFYWLFSLSGILVGLSCRRLAARWLLLVMGIAWAALQIPVLFATNAHELLWARMLLGAAEGPAFPFTVVALFQWFPDEKRNLPVAVVSTGASIGLVLAGLLIPSITAAWGWRSNFAILAAIGALWSLLWLGIGCNPRLIRGSSEGRSADARGNAGYRLPDALPYRTLFADRSVLAIYGGAIAGYTVLGITMTWLPLYLQRGLGYSAASAGRWFTVVVLILMPVQVFLSGLSQRLMRRGTSSRNARAKLLGAAMIISALLLVALGKLPLAPIQKTVVIALSSGLGALATAFGPVLLAEVTPLGQQPVMLAIFTAIGNIAAAVAAVATGHLVQAAGAANPHGYELGYMGAAGVIFCAAIGCLRWLHTERSRRKLCAPTSHDDSDESKTARALNQVR